MKNIQPKMHKMRFFPRSGSAWTVAGHARVISYTMTSRPRKVFDFDVRPAGVFQYYVF